MKTKSEVRAFKVHQIERGKLPSGTSAWIGFCKVNKRKVKVASINKEAGSWFSFEDHQDEVRDNLTKD